MIDITNQVTRALTASDGSVTSADFDLGKSPGVLGEHAEFKIEIPSLTSTQLASADTLTMVVQHGNSATPSTAQGFSKVLTGTGSTIPATTWYFRPSSDIGRYVNFKFTTAGTTGDMSALKAKISLVAKV